MRCEILKGARGCGGLTDLYDFTNTDQLLAFPSSGPNELGGDID